MPHYPVWQLHSIFKGRSEIRRYDNIRLRRFGILTICPCTLGLDPHTPSRSSDAYPVVTVVHPDLCSHESNAGTALLSCARSSRLRACLRSGTSSGCARFLDQISLCVTMDAGSGLTGSSLCGLPRNLLYLFGPALRHVNALLDSIDPTAGFPSRCACRKCKIDLDKYSIHVARPKSRVVSLQNDKICDV